MGHGFRRVAMEKKEVKVHSLTDQERVELAMRRLLDRAMYRLLENALVIAVFPLLVCWVAYDAEIIQGWLA